MVGDISAPRAAQKPYAIRQPRSARTSLSLPGIDSKSTSRLVRNRRRRRSYCYSRRSEASGKITMFEFARSPPPQPQLAAPAPALPHRYCADGANSPALFSPEVIPPACAPLMPLIGALNQGKRPHLIHDCSPWISDYGFDGVVGYRICLTHRRSPVRTRVEPFF